MHSLNGQFAFAQHQGDRDEQEDHYGFADACNYDHSNNEHSLLVLADGMGGHAGGKVASHIITQTAIEAYKTKPGPVSDRLRQSINAANNQLAKHKQQHGHLKGMGSTAVAAVVSDKGLEWLSVGDSPMWLMRNNHLHRMNADHSLAPVLQSLAEAGHITAKEAATDPKRHQLRSAIVGDDIELVDQSSQPVAIGTEDILILASDGLQTLTEAEIEDTAAKCGGQALQYLADRLIEAVTAKQKPHQDNTTILLYRPGGDYGFGKTPPLIPEIAKTSPASRAVDHEAKTSRTHRRYSKVYLSVLATLAVVLIGYGVFHRSEQIQPAPIEQIKPPLEVKQTEPQIEPHTPGIDPNKAATKEQSDQPPEAGKIKPTEDLDKTKPEPEQSASDERTDLPSQAEEASDEEASPEEASAEEESAETETKPQLVSPPTKE